MYEIAAGRRAFAGSSNAVISAAILHHEPIAPRQIRSELPARLEDGILKTLEKDRGVRCQTAAELRADLTRLKRDLDPVRSDSAATRPSPVSPSSDAQMVAGLIKRHWTRLTIGAVVVAIAVVAGVYALWPRGAAPMPAASVSLADLQVVRLTTSGNASAPAISPDGKYVAYSQPEGKDASVWIRQTATPSNVRIVAPGPFRGATYRPAVTVTPDFVDLVRVEDDGKLSSALWRVPFLGGTPKRLLDNIASPISWSPDGRSFAFVRGRGSALLVADADGRNERVLVGERQLAKAFFVFLEIPGNPHVQPAWSPNGRLIALNGFRVAGGDMQPLFFFTSVADGSVQEVPVPTGVTGLAWLDDSSLVLAGARNYGGLSQLWKLSYPSGELTRFWVGDGEAVSGTEVVPPAPHETNFGFGMAWAGEHLVYTATTGEHSSLFRVVPGRETPEEIQSRAQWLGAGTSDGRALVFTSTQSGAIGSLWKIDPDGRHAVQIAPGNVFAPVVMRDDRSVIFMRNGATVWMIPIEGGTPTQITDRAQYPDVSPDGKSLAFFRADASNQAAIIVCELPGCKTLKRLPPMPTGAKLKWTPDGRGIAYHKDSNLWIQPIDGGPARQLTHFTDGRTIPDFAWSRDGKRLAVARMSITNDIVLVKGLRK